MNLSKLIFETEVLYYRTKNLIREVSQEIVWTLSDWESIFDLSHGRFLTNLTDPSSEYAEMYHLTDYNDWLRPNGHRNSWQLHLDYIASHVVCRPKGTSSYTTEELEAQDMIGLYAAPSWWKVNIKKSWDSLMEKWDECLYPKVTMRPKQKTQNITQTVFFCYSSDSINHFGDRSKGVLEVMNRRFTPDAIEVKTHEDLPDVLPHGLRWSELNMLIYPDKETTPMFRFPGEHREHFGKRDTLFYLQAFFENLKGPLYLHIWKERVNSKKGKESRNRRDTSAK